MTDVLGALEVPIPVPLTGKAVADPMLDVLADFLQAAINADCGAAWAQVAPFVANPAIGAAVPVAFANKRDPVEADFSSNELPALFVYRPERQGETGTQDWTIAKFVIHVLWIPPTAQQEHLALRDTFHHAIDASITGALLRLRHPAWIAPGDTDPAAAYRGSFVKTRAGWFKDPTITSAKAEPLKIPRYDDPRTVDTFDAFLVKIEIEECMSPRLDAWDRLDHFESTTNAGAPPGLPVIFKASLTSLTPATGPAAGGTEITIVGSELDDETSFAIGGVPCTNVVRVDEQTFTATTGAHAAGVVDIVATLGSGDTATLAAAFTFT